MLTKKVKIAVRGSFVCNVILAILQTYGATSSLSYSLFATMADSIFDPFSNITLWIAHQAARKIDERKYPAVNYPTIPLCFGDVHRADDGRENRGWRRLGILCFRLL